MKKFTAIFISISALLISGCSHIKKTDAEIERENWIAGFTDSIDYYQNNVKMAEAALESVNNKINSLLSEFEKVNNPREVTGYYLIKGWKSKLPLTSTGIYARINENEKLEIIATLGGSTFNQIAVGTSNPEIYSEIVPHDQAFNFRHERFNTVYFSGEKADSVAQFIYDNIEKKISLSFLEGKIKKTFVLPENEKDMIANTWQLFETQREARKLQKKLWVSSKKIETFRRLMIEASDNK